MVFLGQKQKNTCSRCHATAVAGGDVVSIASISFVVSGIPVLLLHVVSVGVVVVMAGM